MAETTNYYAIGKGNQYGEIKFGHIHEDGNIAAAILRSGVEPNHYISLDSTGTNTRTHGTICRATGTFQIIAGDNVPPDIHGVYIDSGNGDLVLKAPSGRVRIEGRNINLTAVGENGRNGVITLNGSEKVLIDSPIVDVAGRVATKIVSEGTVDVIGKTILNIYGGLIDAADGATSVKGSKPCAGPYVNELRNML